MLLFKISPIKMFKSSHRGLNARRVPRISLNNVPLLLDDLIRKNFDFVVPEQ